MDTNSCYRNERHKGVANLLYTYNNVASRLQKLLSEYNLTLQQSHILCILNRYHPKPVCNCSIREQMFDARSDVTRIVDRLIKNGFVKRDISSIDRRKVNISLTDRGVDILNKMEPMRIKMDEIMSCLTEEELSEWNRLHEKVRSCK